MRSTLRIAFVALAAFIVLSLGLFWFHRDDWRQHLHDAAAYRPHYTSPWAAAGGEHDRRPDADASAAAQNKGAPLADIPSVEAPDGLETPAQELEESGQGEPAPERAIVMAKLQHEDTEWVHELTDWTPYIYVVDNTSALLHTPVNKGRESLAYLSYIISHYSNLGTTIAFLHPHKDGYPAAWHTEFDAHSNPETLAMLKIPHVQETGYANLRCNPNPGCGPEIQPFRDPPEEWRTAEAAVGEAWLGLFGPDEPLPREIGAACCAQFAVSAAQVRKRPRADYVRFREWVLATELSDDVAGRIMEYMWHVVFGREPVHCPAVQDCYCDVYGLCQSWP